MRRLLEGSMVRRRLSSQVIGLMALATGLVVVPALPAAAAVTLAAAGRVRPERHGHRQGRHRVTRTPC
jgi:hypothetical protein